MDAKEGEASYSGDARDGRAQRRRERTSAALVGFDGGGGREEEEEEKGREREGARGRVASERSWAWRLGFSTVRSAQLIYHTLVRNERTRSNMNPIGRSDFSEL